EGGGGDGFVKKGKGNPEESAQREFRGYDKNGDGYLSEEEIMTHTRFFKDEWTKWDTSPKDGKISLEEYTKYVEDRFQRGGGGFGKKGQDTGSDPDAKKPIVEVIELDDITAVPDVWRTGKMPVGLPDWFKKLDKNKDGQISIYEWRLGGKEIAEFMS